ncbi:hypothetical protein FXO37_07025 [Capsicum annuum]|nr:hypothetical protein FXO37_07025 [Capsicum annuum]
MHLGFGYIPVQLELVVLAVRWFSGRDMPEKFVNLHEELDKVILETAQIADKMGLAVCMSDEPARKAFIGAPPQFRRYSQQVKEEGGSKVGLFFLGSFAGSLVYMFWGIRQQAKIDKFHADLNVDMCVETYWQFHNLGKRKQSPNE